MRSRAGRIDAPHQRRRNSRKEGASVELLTVLTQKAVIVGLAIAGAALVMASELFGGTKAAAPDRRAMALSKVGYGVTFVSIALFIVAGFISGR